MKSSPRGAILAVFLFVGIFIVPLNCEVGASIDAKNDATGTSTIITTDKANSLPSDTTPVVISTEVTQTTLDPNITTTSPKTTSTTPSTPTLPTTTTKSPDTTTTTTKSPDTTTTTTKSPDTTTTTKSPDTTTTTTKSPDTTTSTTTSTTSTSTTTTKAPDTTTTSKPPLPPPCRRFDGPSFIGGIVLTLGLLAIGLVAYKFYKARNDRNYHTL